MNRILRQKPENTQIEMKTCVNRGGYYYKHAFIDEFAISTRLENILSNEFGFSCRNGETLPDAFFQKYDLIAVSPDYDNKEREHYVTSDYWYTCKPQYTTVCLSL